MERETLDVPDNVAIAAERNDTETNPLARAALVWIYAAIQAVEAMEAEEE